MTIRVTSWEDIENILARERVTAERPIEMKTLGTVGERWKDLVKRIINMSEQIRIERPDKEIFPPHEKVARALFEIPLDKITLVIVGQDPYPNESANGIAFSCRREQRSLSALYKQIDKAGIPRPSTLMTEWRRMGILLINAYFTVERNSPASHARYWRPIYKDLLKILRKYRPDLHYIVLGGVARDLHKKVFGESLDNHIIAPHPCARGGQFSHADIFNDLRNVVPDHPLFHQ
jgi:uracil-DNA glycosylase